MPLSKEAQAAKPKMPQNAYFLFRSEKMAELKDESDKVKKVQKLWETIDPTLKGQLEDDFQKRKDQHKHDTEAWMKKYHLTEDDLKEFRKEKADRKSKQRGRDTDDEEDRKPVKTKGTKETKEEKKKRDEEEKKKAEEEEIRQREHEEKAKSRNASKTLDKGKSKKEESKVEKKKGK